MDCRVKMRVIFESINLRLKSIRLQSTRFGHAGESSAFVLSLSLKWFSIQRIASTCATNKMARIYLDTSLTHSSAVDEQARQTC